MIWQDTPYTLPLGIAAAVALALMIFGVRRYRSPGVASYAWLMLGVTIWSLCALLEIGSADLPGKLMWSKLSYIGIGSVLISWSLFIYRYTGHEKWVTRRLVIALCIEPALVLAFVFTNEAHGLIWPVTKLVPVGSVTLLEVTHGAVFWLHAAYAYILLLFSTILIIRFLVRSKNLYRGQGIALLISVTAPWVGNFVSLAGFSRVDLTPFAFTITGLAVAWGFLRMRLLDIVPVARDAVIESMADALLVIDAQNRVVDVNAAAERLLARNAQDSIGVGMNQLLPALTPSLVQGEFSPEKQVEIVLKVGSTEHTFETRVTPLYSQAHELSGHIVVMHDITERKEAAGRIQSQNEALARANRELAKAREDAEEATRLKSQFLATMSHELRTPLNAIIGYTEIQLAGMSGPMSEEQQSYQRRVLSNSEHLLKLINEILDLAKIEAGRADIVKKPFVLSGWLNEVIQQTEGLARTKGLRFERRLDERLPERIVGDPGRLKQIAINLLSNAIKFTEKGKVSIELRSNGPDGWILAVSDTGVGIPPHMQEVVFEEFRQVDNTSKRSYGGTGLGLAIVRKLVLMMGGSIRLTSAVDEGSTFTIYLPLVEAEKTEAVPAINLISA
jgi:PAS domain S-box-containing protein